MSDYKVSMEQDYSQYYENHQLAGSLDVYLPLIKMDLMMEYDCKAPISTLEIYVCSCIGQGITDRYGIMDVLALEDTVINHVVDELIGWGIVGEEAGQLYLTNTEYDIIDKPKSKQHKRVNAVWCYKGLMNADKKIDTHMKPINHTISIERLLEQEHIFYLVPNILIEVKAEELKDLSPKMFHYPNQKEEEILQVQSLEIIKERTVVYEHYKILFFSGVEGDVKLLVHRVDAGQRVDEAFTKTIQRLYNRSELFNQMRHTTEGDENRLVELNKQIGFLMATSK